MNSKEKKDLYSMSQSEVAERLGLSQPVLHRLESKAVSKFKKLLLERHKDVKNVLGD